MRFARIPKREKRQLNLTGDAAQTKPVLCVKLPARTASSSATRAVEILDQANAVIFSITHDGVVRGNVTGTLTGNVTGNLTGIASSLATTATITEKQVAQSRSWQFPKKNREDQYRFELSKLNVQSSGSLPVGTKLDDLETPDDNTDLNATTARHGLLPKLGGGTSNFLRADGSWTPPAGTGQVGITIDGGGSAITTGLKGFVRIPYAGTITKATLLADQSGSIVVDVWKDTYANAPPTDADSITASAPPTLSGAAKSEDATLTGWTKSITAGDVLAFNVDSVATVTRVTLLLEITKA